MRIGTIQQVWRYPVKSMQGQTMTHCEVASNGLRGDRGWALRDEVAKEIRGGRKWPLVMQCSAAYVVEPTGEMIPPVEIRLPDGIDIASDAVDASARLSAFVGSPVTLWPRQPIENKSHYKRAEFGAATARHLARTPRARRVLQKVMKWTGMDGTLREELSREPGEPLPDLSDIPAELFAYRTLPGTYFDAFPVHILTTATLETMRKHQPSSNWDVRRFRPNFLIETVPELSGLVEGQWVGKNLRIGGIEIKCETPTARCGMTTHKQAELPKDPTVLRAIVREANQNLGLYASVARGGSVSVGDAVELV